MDAAKIQLSKEELALVSDPSWILTKNSIMGRVVALFGATSYKLQAASGGLRAVAEEVQAASYKLQAASVGLGAASEGLDKWPANWDTPKISKGENYLGLPYVMLDYPRLFTREHVFAIRTMFWWGHYFSVTLHLKGRMQEVFLPVIARHTRELAAAGFHIAISEDEWRHEVEADNYLPLGEAASYKLQAAGRHPFLKLSATCGLDKWNEAPEILLGLHKILINALTQ